MEAAVSARSRGPEPDARSSTASRRATGGQPATSTGCHDKCGAAATFAANDTAIPSTNASRLSPAVEFTNALGGRHHGVGHRAESRPHTGSSSKVFGTGSRISKSFEEGRPPTRPFRATGHGVPAIMEIPSARLLTCRSFVPQASAGIRYHHPGGVVCELA